MSVPMAGLEPLPFRLKWGTTSAFLYIILVRAFDPVTDLPREATGFEAMSYLFNNTEIYLLAAILVALPLTFVLQFGYLRCKLYYYEVTSTR